MTERSDSLARLDELLLERATGGLDAAEEAALRALLAAHPEVDEYRYERAAAAVLLASLTAIEPMPASVKRKLAARWRGPRG
jgi:hypothetical protein